jgi:cytochrome c oxidase cbb3-type subunit I/II
VRAFGGSLYLVGFLVMAVNVWKTIAASRSEDLVDETVSAPPVFRLNLAWFKGQAPHRILEGMPTALIILSFLGILTGSLVEIVPMLSGAAYQTEISWDTNAIQKPRLYRPLEVAGRDIYVREGCYTCHSQMIRQMPGDVLRYGEASKAEESMWDHPFQWGSKRTGPDLARVGKKYPDLWHFRHLLNPRDVVPQSIMPSYVWLFRDKLDTSNLSKKLKTLRMVGVPYTDEQINNAVADAEVQALEIATRLKTEGGPEGAEKKEIVALISYLQAMGQMMPPSFKPQKVSGL